MALSMLGYRCCSDLEKLPLYELKRLRDGSADRVFGAYVNVGSVEAMVEDLRRGYPEAKFIVTATPGDPVSQIVQDLLARLEGADVIVLNTGDIHAWRILCEHLRCVPTIVPFPDTGGPWAAGCHGSMQATQSSPERARLTSGIGPPWIVEPDHGAWAGIRTSRRPPEDGNCGPCRRRLSEPRSLALGSAVRHIRGQPGAVPPFECRTRRAPTERRCMFAAKTLAFASTVQAL